MGRLFGTDGVRGKAESRRSITRPCGAWARPWCGHCATATTRFGSWSAAIPANRASGSSRSWRGAFAPRARRSRAPGIIPTPAIAYLTPRLGYTAGLVISASHNPFEDNGIKVFSGAGEKFTEALEDTVEAHMLDEDVALPPLGAPVERIDYRSQYIDHLEGDSSRPTRAARALRIAVDCANGATTTIAPRLFQELGIEARCIGCAPDGRNINLNCGSTHPGGARAYRRRRRVRSRHRVRRRRRPCDLRRCGRQDGRRRCRDAAVREADEDARAASRATPSWRPS